MSGGKREELGISRWLSGCLSHADEISVMALSSRLVYSATKTKRLGSSLALPASVIPKLVGENTLLDSACSVWRLDLESMECW